MGSRGVVFGFDVSSSLDLLFLRDGPGEPLTVSEGVVPVPRETEPFMEWRPRDGNPFEAKLFESDGGFVLDVPELGSYGVDPRGSRVVVPPGADPIRREERLWGIPMAICLIDRGDLALHAASVEVAGRALLLCGPSRFGKTSLAAGFLRRGHRILSEDMTCARPGREPSVLPGPALLRMRRDVAQDLGRIDGTSIRAEDDDRIHLSLEGRARGGGAPVPLAGVVVLRRGTSDVELYRVSPERFVPELFTVGFVPPTHDGRARGFTGVVDLLGAVPVWLLDRPLEMGLLDHVVGRLIAECFA